LFYRRVGGTRRKYDDVFLYRRVRVGGIIGGTGGQKRQKVSLNKGRGISGG